MDGVFWGQFGSGVFYSAASLARSLNGDRFFAGGRIKLGFSILQGMTDQNRRHSFQPCFPRGLIQLEISDGAIRLPAQVLVVERTLRLHCT